jgi:hypothetical protein
MRTLLGAGAGYASFVILGTIALLALVSWSGLDVMVAAGQLRVPALWLAIGLFITGWISGISGRIAARIADRPEAALLLGVVIAVQGLTFFPGGAGSTIPDPARVELMTNLELLTWLRIPDWYARSLPLFAAAFIGYGGYLYRR